MVTDPRVLEIRPWQHSSPDRVPITVSHTQTTLSPDSRPESLASATLAQSTGSRAVTTLLSRRLMSRLSRESTQAVEMRARILPALRPIIGILAILMVVNKRSI